MESIGNGVCKPGSQNVENSGSALATSDMTSRVMHVFCTSCGRSHLAAAGVKCRVLDILFYICNSGYAKMGYRKYKVSTSLLNVTVFIVVVLVSISILRYIV